MKKSLEDIYTEGMSILAMVKYAEQSIKSEATRDISEVHEIYKSYNLWQDRLKNFINATGLSMCEKGFFFEPDSVPLPLRSPTEGRELLTLNSGEEAEELLGKIRKETEKKLDKLMDFEAKIDKSSENKKPEIIISKKDGIYDKKTELCYPIRGKKRFELIRFLKDGHRSGPELVEHQGQKMSMINKEIKSINKCFKNELKLKNNPKNNLIVKVRTGGFELNHKKFNIKFTK